MKNEIFILKKSEYFVLRMIIFFLMIIFQFRCAYTTHKSASIEKMEDQETNKIYYYMKDNYLPPKIDDIFKTKDCTLDLYKVSSIYSNESEYLVRFFYSSYTDTFLIDVGNEIIILADSSAIKLIAHSVEYGHKEVTAYYQISVLDIIEICRSNSVYINIYGVSNQLDREFSQKNIENYNNFANKVIFDSDGRIDESLIGKSEISKLRGFISFGVGTGYEAWIAYYTNIIKKNNMKELGDFIALGFGTATFNYDRYIHRSTSAEPPPRYWYDYFDSNQNRIWYFNLMYGQTHPSSLGNWSVDLGLTFHYYFLDDRNWNEYVPREVRWGIIPQYEYKITDGDADEGFAMGLFIQAGIFWFRINTKNYWATGLSLPIRF